MSHSVASTNERVYREDTLYSYERSIERAIRVMHERLCDPLTIDDLADAAFMSRYHFTRVFSKVTGVSPARFLAAVRMQEAKRLLLKTDRSVTDVSLDVGYNSLGTFTRIFADFVGFSPIRFRQLSRPLLRFTVDEIVKFLPPNNPHSRKVSFCGEVVCNNQLALVTVAMFPTSIPKSHPIECICLSESLRFSFSRTLPHGGRIFAAGLLPTATIEDAILVTPGHVQLGAIHLSHNMSKDLPSLDLRSRHAIEPPVVVAFPLLIVKSLMTNK